MNGKEPTVEEPAGRGWSTALRRTPELPSWLISLVLHVAIFLVLALTLPAAPRLGAAPERIADVGIVLKHHDGEHEYYQSEGDDGRDAETAVAAADAAGVARLDEVLPAKPPIDSTATLPAAMNVLGFSAGGEGVPNAGGAAEGPAGKNRTLGGGGRTSVFGVPGEGFKFAYVFDRSASMGGSARNALSAAQTELIHSLESLDSIHQFMIVFYNERQEVFNPSGQPGKLPFATEQNKERAKRFVRGITAFGSTRHEDALMEALKTRPDVIFFLTDADEPRMSTAQLNRVRRRANGVTINAIEFGRGAKPGGENFLQALARQNGGGYGYVDITTLFPAE